MASISFMTEHHKFPWSRQLTERVPMQGQPRFTINRIDPDCELLVVYDDIGTEFTTALPRERLMCVLSEPQGIKAYRSAFVAQFGTSFGPIDPKRTDVTWQQSQPGLAWFYGLGFVDGKWRSNLSVNTLKAMPPPPKTQTVSAVISNKTRLPMHRQRIAFVMALKERLGDTFHIYGNGFQPIPDKADAIAPHAYHLVLENNDIEHFWTEKTADAYLGWSLPIFSGCRNLGEYFPEQSFIRNDISDISQAVGRVIEILDRAPYEELLPAIAQARERLIESHELSACLRRAWAAIPAGTPKTGTSPARIRANRNLGPTGLLEPAARRVARRLLGRPPR